MNRIWNVMVGVAAISAMAWLALVIVNAQHLLAQGKARSAEAAFAAAARTPIW